MNPERQRIKIAEALYPQFPVFRRQDGTLRHQYPNGGSGPVADYLDDLNACIPLIEFLEKRGWKCRINNYIGIWTCTFERYTRETDTLIEHDGESGSIAGAICETFLRVMNLWEEEP